MSTVMTPARPKSVVEQVRAWLSPLNLHFAGLGLLVLIIVYLLIHMVVLWQTLSSNNAEAVAQQRIALKTAEIAAEPLRGLDAKLDRASLDADAFYGRRLPASDSALAAELGVLTKKQGVRYTRAQYGHTLVLTGSAGELTEVRIDASLSGDYRPLMQFINSLERDRMFFVIDAVTLTGQQSGTVNLRLRLKTYLRGRVPLDEAAGSEAGTDAAVGTPVESTAGGAGR